MPNCGQTNSGAQLSPCDNKGLETPRKVRVEIVLTSTPDEPGLSRSAIYLPPRRRAPSKTWAVFNKQNHVVTSTPNINKRDVGDGDDKL